MQSSLVVHWGAPASLPVEQGPQLPALQHCPAPHSALAVHWHSPHWRVVGSQHWPALQSRLVLQQGAHAPPIQHWPAPHAASEQHAAVMHWPPLQQRPAPHSASVVHVHVGRHWWVPGSQHSPALQSRLLLQQGWHDPPIQHVPGPQSPSAQHAAVTHAPVSVQHLSEPQSPWPARPCRGTRRTFACRDRTLARGAVELARAAGPATHAPLTCSTCPHRTRHRSSTCTPCSSTSVGVAALARLAIEVGATARVALVIAATALLRGQSVSVQHVPGMQ